MRALRLYPGVPRAPVEDEPPLGRDPSCARCPLGGGAGTCMPADGDPGGLLVVGEAPSAAEARAGRPHTGAAGQLVRRLVAANWGGPAAYTNALLCRPLPAAGKNVGQRRKISEACRGYLAQTLAEVRPARVVAMGALAAYSVLGRAPDPKSVSGGRGWLSDGTPVILLPSPGLVVGNRFLRARFEADLAAALRAASLGDPPWVADPAACLVEDAEAAATARIQLLWESEGGRVVVDVETAGQVHEPGLFRLLSVAVCAERAPDPAVPATVFVWSAAALSDLAARAELAAVLGTRDAVTHGGKFDLQALAMAGLPLRPGADTMLQRRLVDAGSDASLEVVAELVGMGGHKEEAREAGAAAVAELRSAWADSRKPEAKTAKTREKRAAGALRVAGAHPLVVAGLERGWEGAKYAGLLLEPDVLHRYNALDALTTARFLPWVEERLAAEPGIQFVWEDVLSRATRAFAAIETWGVAVDRGAVERAALWLDVQQRDLLGRLRCRADINWRSPQRVGEYLFEDLGLPNSGKTAGGQQWATDEAALAKLRGRHPAADELLALRSLDKTRGTYADGGKRLDGEHPFALGTAGLIQWILSDGRIHLNYNITGTETGRPSGDSPNLLNQPRPETEAGKMVRDCYVAPPGRVLVEFDRSQIEIRVLAALSGDPDMRQIFVDGRDIYLETARSIAWVWNRQPGDIVKEGPERQDSKVVVLSLAYQKGPKQLAEDLGCPVDHAVRVSDAIMGRYKKFASWVQGQKREVLRTGEVRTRWRGRPARRRYLHDAGWAGEEHQGRVAEALRCAVNTPPQGGASEYTTASVIDVVDWIEGDAVNAKLVLTVYDSVMLEVGEDSLPEVLHVVPRIMAKNPLEYDVPLVTDAKVGVRWGSMKKV